MIDVVRFHKVMRRYYLIVLFSFFIFSFNLVLLAPSDAEEPVKYIIREISCIGNNQMTYDLLSAQIPISVGKEYNRDAIVEGKYNLLSFYAEHGYIYAKVKDETLANETTGDVTIVYDIHEGIQAYIGKITVVGNTKTHDRVIWRELLIQPGEIYNRKLVFASQRKLMLLGIFDEVKIEPRQELGEIESEIVDLVITVKERKTGVVSFGTGYSTEEGMRGYARYRQSNLFGKGQRFGASLFLSEHGELVERGREAKLDFFEPYLFNTLYGFGDDIYYRQDKYDNYILRRRGGDIYLSRFFSEDNIRWILKYRFEQDKTFDFKNIIDTSIKALEGKQTNIGSFSSIITKDTRDNLAYPHRGYIQSLSLELANRGFGSDVDFVKIIGDWRTYLQIKQSEWVLGLRATSGITRPYGGSDSIPIYERFYAGGADSVRGFKERYLGPKDNDGYPVGGEAMMVLNAELRFPIYKQFGGVIFYDTGNVWTHPSQIRLNEIQSAVGIGFRYQTPIGPFRLDYGIRIPRVDIGRFHISVGQTF